MLVEEGDPAGGLGWGGVSVCVCGLGWGGVCGVCVCVCVAGGGGGVTGERLHVAACSFKTSPSILDILEV